MNFHTANLKKKVRLISPFSLYNTATIHIQRVPNIFILDSIQLCRICLKYSKPPLESNFRQLIYSININIEQILVFYWLAKIKCNEKICRKRNARLAGTLKLRERPHRTLNKIKIVPAFLLFFVSNKKSACNA